MQIILIVGLPGAGKTTVAMGLYYATEVETQVVDDIRDLHQLPNPGECDFLIITDPHLCAESTQYGAAQILEAKYPGCHIAWHFFENNPAKCFRNVEWRNAIYKEKRIISKASLEALSKHYSVPHGYTQFPVWSGD